MALHYLGSPYVVTVDTTPRDIYGVASDLELFVTPPGSTTASKSTATFAEVIEDRPANAPASLTLAADAAVGSVVLSVTTAPHTDMVGRVYAFSDGTDTFYTRIKSVDTTANTITLTKPLPFALPASGSTISYYGGTGVYTASVNLATLGQYVLHVRAPSVGLRVGAQSVTVVEEPAGGTASEPYARIVG